MLCDLSFRSQTASEVGGDGRLWVVRQVRLMRTSIVAIILCVTVLSACSKDSDPSSQASRGPEWERGRAVYVANCVACHNSDPAKDGPIGPALKGSGQELLEARVLTSNYPPNYQPKRPTKVMPQFPFLKTEIPFLAAYLR
jgi:mono/diheme cytochrome c family protein